MIFKFVEKEGTYIIADWKVAIDIIEKNHKDNVAFRVYARTVPT